MVLTLTLGQTSTALHIPIGYVYLVLPLSGLLIMYYAVLVQYVGDIRRSTTAAVSSDPADQEETG